MDSPNYSDELFQLYRDLQKDSFLSRVNSNYNLDEIQLNEVRCSLLEELKCFEEFPYGPVTELMRRITKTHLYSFDPLKPHFYIIKLGFTGVYIIVLISAQKHRLWVLVRTASSRRF